MIWAVLLIVAIGSASIPWLLVAGARFGSLLAFCGLLLTAGLLLLATLLVSAAVGADVTIAIAAVVGVAGLVGVGVAVRSRRIIHRPTRATLALFLPTLAGAGTWLGTSALAQVLPGAARLSWVMNGDAVNNLYYSKAIFAAHGIGTGGLANPVPLPAAVLTTVLGPGRADVTAHALLAHDLAGFALTWIVLLAVMSVVTGAVVASLVPARRLGVRAIVSGLGSLLPLTWFVAGLPIQAGYLNAHVALPIAFASWLVFVGSRRSVIVAVALQGAATTLLLATWAPLAAVPVALALVSIARARAVFTGLRRSQAAVILVAVAQALVFLAVLTVPTTMFQASAINNPGTGFPSTWVALVVAAASTIVLAAALRRRLGPSILAGAVGLVAAALAGVAVVLALALPGDPLSSYYPVKLSWLLVVFLGAIALSLAVRAALEWIPRASVAAAGAAGLAAAMVVVAAVAPVLVRGVPSVSVPAARILTGSIWHTGDRAVTRILDLTGPGRLGLLWQSGDPDEGMIDYWLIISNGADLSGEGVARGAAFDMYHQFAVTGSYDDSNVSALCDILSAVTVPITVHTANPELRSHLDDTCPSAKATVAVGRS